MLLVSHFHAQTQVELPAEPEAAIASELPDSAPPAEPSTPAETGVDEVPGESE